MNEVFSLAKIIFKLHIKTPIQAVTVTRGRLRGGGLGNTCPSISFRDRVPDFVWAL